MFDIIESKNSLSKNEYIMIDTYKHNLICFIKLFQVWQNRFCLNFVSFFYIKADK